ncbi:Y-family DNA polymerase [Undibacterium flavidum]|uniref:DNA polymerase Y family protein n=1 Tax=Undibacterium flavidum TaxID=2762297 RepID=A0ABR6YDV8_9BURK|nr:DNA polymerase Y family protein [Undibacterium flavidum]MBC3874741.1 DNA polymerase Y family protein [Undibacterium flavidum]
MPSLIPPLWIAIYLPQLALEVFRPRWLSDSPNETINHPTDYRHLVVCEQQTVYALSEALHAYGLLPGMRQNSIALLCEQAEVRQRDPGLEQTLRQQVAISLLQYSPQVSFCEDHTDIILIEVATSLRLFGGIRRLYHRIRQDLRHLGVSVQIGIARNASAASLLAQKARHKIAQKPTQKIANKIQGKQLANQRCSRQLQLCLSNKRLAQHLDPLPCYLLPAAHPYLDWLQGIACTDLGAIRNLPRAGLQRRCGKALLKALDIAYGEQVALHQWITVPDSFHAHCEPPDRINKTETIFHFTRGLVLQLCGWLNQQQKAIKQLTLLLEHERGRQAVAPSMLQIPFAKACWQEEHITRLLKEKLAQWQLNSPAIAIRLEVDEMEARQALSTSLFPDQASQSESESRLLELLIARLGAEQVLQAAPRADHRPEVANRWVSVLEKSSRKTQTFAFNNPRPSWLLNIPLSLSVRQHSPYYGSRLKLLSPAERIEAGWWNGQLVTRDYFIAECSKHYRYWIYRERIGQERLMQEDEAWFLHGVFG